MSRSGQHCAPKIQKGDDQDREPDQESIQKSQRVAGPSSSFPRKRESRVANATAVAPLFKPGAGSGPAAFAWVTITRCKDGIHLGSACEKILLPVAAASRFSL